MVSSPKHVCSIHKVTTKEIHALPSWVKAEGGNLYVVKLCMNKKKKTHKNGILGIITADQAKIYITILHKGKG